MKLFKRMHKRVFNALEPDTMSECNHEFHYAGTREVLIRNGYENDYETHHVAVCSRCGLQVESVFSNNIQTLIKSSEIRHMHDEDESPESVTDIMEFVRDLDNK